MFKVEEGDRVVEIRSQSDQFFEKRESFFRVMRKCSLFSV